MLAIARSGDIYERRIHLATLTHQNLGQLLKWGVKCRRYVVQAPLPVSLTGPLYMASLLSFAFSRAFLFPSDQQLDLDLWVEQAELSCSELHQMRAEDNCLFSINPKAGTLSPGQEQMVEFKYRCSCTPCPVPPSRRSLALTFLCVTPGDPRQSPWEALSCRGGLCRPCLLPAQRWWSGSKLHCFPT